ncbi:subtilisin-like protease SBT1.6 [Tanacetum coccineum]|uniref:Subtilisin-like protease SBT1.6 n=1 Tax=Tanacetum coccineum TaxID=301880 RepID=A0ABQ4XG21_9ASTR
MGTTMGTIRFAVHGDPDRYRTAIGNARSRSKIAKGLAIPVTMDLCSWNTMVSGYAKAGRGKIVICDRGSNPRVAKGLVVKKAGGVGMTLSNGVTNGEGLEGDAHLIPACSVGSDEGDKIKAYAATGRATATINFKGTVLGIKPAPVMASFSGRGPNGMNPEILKPDLIAPGVNILAAWTDAVGPTGLESDSRKTEFNILSGTSMSSPHVSGAAALLKSAHLDWSPAAIKSAIMTTASTVNKQLEPMTDESTGNATTPYNFGVGHLNLDLAMDPGLVYDLRNEDYVSFLCSIRYGAKTIQVITRSPAACPLRRKPVPENLNYPSIAALFSTGKKGVLRNTLIRRVRNVGDVNSVYTVKVQAPKGVMISVRPGKLVFSDKVRELSYYVTVKIDGTSVVMGDSGAVFGSFSWVDGKHVIRSPIVVTQRVGWPGENKFNLLKDYARNVFDEMCEKDLCSWNTIVFGYAKAGRVNDARIVFDEMVERDNLDF